jgi:hypothetical protein
MAASQSSVVESSLEGEWVGRAKDLAGLQLHRGESQERWLRGLPTFRERACCRWIPCTDG